MPKKKTPTNNPNNPSPTDENAAPKRTKKPKRSDEELLEDLKAQVRERERRIAMKKLKETDEGKQITILTKAADLLMELKEDHIAEDIQDVCKKIAEDAGVEIS